MMRDSLFVRMKISGDGIDPFFGECFGRGIYLDDLIYDKNECFFTVKAADERKIFAISRNMCYNVEKIGYKGRASFIKKCLSALGMCVGAVMFTIFAKVSDGVVGEIVCKGDAASFRREIIAVLKDEGIEEGKICSADLPSLGEKIALKTDGVSYATVVKSGRRIIVDLKRDADKNDPLDVGKAVIVSTVSGRIVKINVLSGVAAVKVGDEVKSGDTLIVGEYVHGDTVIKTYALGEVAIETTFVYEYEASGEGDLYKNRALALGKAVLDGKDVISSSVREEKRDGKIIYTATFVYTEIVN